MYSPARLCWIQYTRPRLTMKTSRRVLRAQRTPKGANPFSAPQLFAGSRAPRRKARAQALPMAQSVQAPVARTRVMKGLQGNPDQSTLLRRREYVGDIPGSVTFATTGYNFNPGLANLFPWASQFANSYDEYVVTNVSFIYEPEQASSATGSVILSFDYDASDAAPVDKVSALETKDSVRSAPWTPSRLTLAASDLKHRCAEALFTRSATVPSTDIKTYDLGVLYVSTVGQASTAICGELWIEYTIQLRVPQRASNPGSNVIASTSITKSVIFGTAATITGTPTFSVSGSTMTFNSPGYILLAYLVTGTVLVTPTITPSTGATATLIAATTDSGQLNQVGYFVARVLSGSTILIDFSASTTVTAFKCDVGSYFSSSV